MNETKSDGDPRRLRPPGKAVARPRVQHSDRFPYFFAAFRQTIPTAKTARSTNAPCRFQTVKKGHRPQKQHKFGKRAARWRFFLFISPKCGWPLRANAFAFCVVRLLPYPYTPTEAHSLPLQPFRQPPSVSKNYPIGSVSGIIEETGVFSWKTGEKTHGESRSL